MHFIPFLRIRGTEEAELVGLDEHEIGEYAYDYVGLEQEIGHETGIKGTNLSGGREPEHHPHHSSSDGETSEKRI